MLLLALAWPTRDVRRLLSEELRAVKDGLARDVKWPSEGDSDRLSPFSRFSECFFRFSLFRDPRNEKAVSIKLFRELSEPKLSRSDNPASVTVYNEEESRSIQSAGN